MISQSLIDRVEELKRTTYSDITEMQTNLCPMIKDIYLNYQFEYWYDGYRYNLWEDDMHVYACNELPWCYDNEIRNTVFQDTLDNLIYQEKVWPMLLFVNGCVIKWSDIQVFHDYDYTYLKIHNILPDYSTSATIIYFPIPVGMIRYGEDNDVTLGMADKLKALYFNLDGKYINDDQIAYNDLSVRLELYNDYPNLLYFKKVKIGNILEDPGSAFKLSDLPYGAVPKPENIILFDSNGLLVPNSKDAIIDDWKGVYNLFKYDADNFDINSTAVFMYSNQYNNLSSHLYIRSEDIDQESVEKWIKETAVSDDPDSLYQKMIAPAIKQFDFSFSRNNTYNGNINLATKYITQYDYSLWNKVFIEECPIKSFQYTGAEFKRMSSSDDSYVRWSRRRDDKIESMAMMFVNSKLYNNSIDISFINNTLNLPTFGILDEDHVEVVLFTRVNNNILDLHVESNTEPVYISPIYDLDDCYIMSEECDIASYQDVPDSPEHRKQYIVDIQSYTKDNDNNYKITFNDPEYYGKDLKIVPKNQFRYYRFTQIQGQFKIILPTQFNYCHDINRYMIFVNGKKIDKTEYTITIMNQFRPFDKLVLYLSTILDEEDYVDIYYLPEELVEKYKEDNISTRGYLLLSEPDNYPKMYSFSKYTNMVFLNGLKVNPLDIKDVSMNSMLINTDLNSIDNVTVMEYLTGSEDIAKALIGMQGVSVLMGDTNYNISDEKDLHDIVGVVKDIVTQADTQVSIATEDVDFSKELADEWKQLVDYLRDEQGGSTGYAGIEAFYGLLGEIENPDKNYKEDYAALRSILYDVVVDYYLKREGATTGSPFVYDFEMQEWYPNTEATEDLIDGWTYFVDHQDQFFVSDKGELFVAPYSDRVQTKLITLYPDHDKLLDYYLNDNIADTDDVRLGEKFIKADYD